MALLVGATLAAGGALGAPNARGRMHASLEGAAFRDREGARGRPQLHRAVQAATLQVAGGRLRSGPDDCHAHAMIFGRRRFATRSRGQCPTRDVPRQCESAPRRAGACGTNAARALSVRGHRFLLARDCRREAPGLFRSPKLRHIVQRSVEQKGAAELCAVAGLFSCDRL
jgi:hypothetical protein